MADDTFFKKIKEWSGENKKLTIYSTYEGAFQAYNYNWYLELDTGVTATGDEEILIGDFLGVAGADPDGLDANIANSLDTYLKTVEGETKSYTSWNKLPSLVKFLVATSTAFKDFSGEGSSTAGGEVLNLYRDMEQIVINQKGTVEYAIILHRTKRLFRNFVLKNKIGDVEFDPSKNKLSENEIELYKTYKKILELANQANDNSEPFKTRDSISLLNIQIVKQKGDSEFLKQFFGDSISQKFNLKSFRLRIDDMVRETVDNAQGPPEVEVLCPTYQGASTVFRYPDYENEGEVIEAESSDLKVLQESVIYQEAYIGKGNSGVAVVNGQKLGIFKGPGTWPVNDSPVYKKPTKFGKIKSVSNAKGRDPLYNPEWIQSTIYPNPEENALSDQYTWKQLGQLYNPQLKREEGWLWGFNETKDGATGVDDIIFGHYMRFISSIKFQIANDNELENTIGELFAVEARDTSNHIYPIVLGIWTEFTIFAKFREISKTPKDKLKDLAKKDSNALNDLEKQAEQVLNDVAITDLEDEKLTPEDIERRQKLYKQCALLLNAHTLRDDYSGKLINKIVSADPVHSNNFFNGRFWMVEDKPNHNTALNKLVTPTGEAAKPFMEITPDIIAALQPRLRLHKIYKTKNNKIQTHEIPFESFYPKSRSEGLSNGATFDKGAGYGIKEFSFSFDGETPATAQKFIKAKLSLYFQTFNDFIKERTLQLQGETYTFRYLDLFVNTKFCPRSGLNSFSPLYYDPSFYRLRVDVGWEPRNDDQFQEILSKRYGGSIGTGKFADALNRINKTFYLNLLDHSININEDGTVTIDAEYMAYMQGVLQSNSFNALTTKYARQQQKKYAEQYEELLSNDKCTPEQLDELAASINSISDKISQSLHQGVIKRLIKNDALYHVTIKDTAVNDFRNTDFFSKIPILHKSGITVAPDKGSAVANAKNAEELNKLIQSSFIQDTEYRENRKIYFFFMADLIYIILDSLYNDDGTQDESAENLKIILSSFSFKNPYLTNDVHLNIGQIPIDVDTFLSWYEREIIKKDITAMPILTFIKRLLHYLVQDVFLETCINRQEHKRLVFQSTSFLAADEDASEVGANGEQTANSSNDPLGTLFFDTPVANLSKAYGFELPLKTGIRLTGPKPTSQFYNYLFIYPHYRSAQHVGKGDPFEDESRGVHHLYIGADRGLTKKISFSKSDIQYIRESRMMQQGSNGLLQLSSVYRASVSMVGNTLFYPGMEVYINPFGFGGLEFGLPNQGPGTVQAPNLSNIMGIGGYYQILKVSSKISPGSFTTDIDAHFIYSGDGKPVNRDGVVKLDLSCNNSIKDVSKGEEGTDDCRTVILDAQNVVLNSDGTSTTTSTSGEAVNKKETDSD